MSLSVLDVLRNAEMNLRPDCPQCIKDIGVSQLSNAIKQLDQNSDADKEFIEEEDSDE